MSLMGAVVVLVIFLFGVQEFFRRTGKGAAWGFFFVLPVLLAPSWDVLDHYGLFIWVKLHSMLVMACWLTGVRFTPLGRRKWARYGLIVLGAVNILEAIGKDLCGRSLAHYLNAASGALLLLTLPGCLGAVTIDDRGGHRDILCQGMPRSWIVGYTLWNWAFVYLNYPSFAGHQLAVLASALVVGLVEPRRWAQARVYTLTTDGLLLATFPLLPGGSMDTSSWSSLRGEYLGALAGLAFMALFTSRSAAAFLRRRPGDFLCPETTGV